MTSGLFASLQNASYPSLPFFAAGHGAGLLAFMALVMTGYGRATSGCHGGGQVPLASHGET